MQGVSECYVSLIIEMFCVSATPIMHFIIIGGECKGGGVFLDAGTHTPLQFGEIAWFGCLS